MKLEWNDRRILGAIRCTDAVTRLSIGHDLKLSASGVRLVRNRRGYYVITTAPGFDTYRHSFLPPTPPPAPTSIQFTVTDPLGCYLPRQVAIQLPRDPDPANAEMADSLFQPIDLRLYPSPIAPIEPGWAVIRATVTNSSNQRLPWALIRVTLPEEPTPYLSQADWRGEALVAVPGIPVTNWVSDASAEPDADSPVSTIELDASLEVLVDPMVQPIPATADLGTIADPNPNYFPNPEVLNASPTTQRSAPISLILAAGRDRPATLAVSLS
ncbi:hypothetical protein ACN4EK_29160 [Pantanalinema rosaneae CENA516]|uniref:hypothetical protein n=1 Tax=Pantanalinema rosaneae TaxID=1620701 RepID=UPI003D7004DA